MKATAISILVAVVLVGGAVALRGQPSSADAGVATIVGEQQFVDISARGGYSPRVVTAKAGMPTILRVKTNGTFDCSASLVIPKLSYQKFLQPSATEEILIPAEQAVGTVQGLCSMGMYSFQVRFN